jgi:protein TonB
MVRLGAILMAVALFVASGTTRAQETWPPPGVVRLGPGVTAPRLLSQVDPKYTEAGVRGKIQGTVTVEFIIELDGSVGATKIVQSLDAASGLDEAAIAALKQWRFTVAIKDGVPVRALASAVLEFRLRTEPPPMTMPPGFVAAGALPDDWTTTDVPLGPVSVALPHPPQWMPIPSQPPTVKIVGAATGQRSCGVFQAMPAPPQLSLPLPPDRVTGFSGFMSRQLGPRASIRSAGQVRTAAHPWLWLELDLNDDARGWSFATTANGHLVQLLCTVMTPRLQQTEQERNLAIAGAAVEFSAILTHLRIRQP